MSARILALDVGARRIGLALSDELGLTAQGLPTLTRIRERADLEALSALAMEHGVVKFVVGLPIHLSGREGEQAATVRRLGAALRGVSRLPVEFWDERLTTVEAGRVLKLAHSSRARTRQSIDRLSAVILLQSYLDAQALR